MREWITTCGEVFGAALFSAGMWDLSHALGLISAGALTVTGCWLAAR